MAHHNDYQKWPFLTAEEFELACALFDQRYVRARLGPKRQMLKVRARRTATTGQSHIEILRLLPLREERDDLALAFEKLNGGDGSNSVMDVEMDTTNEDEDQEVLRPDSKLAREDAPPQYNPYSHQPYVTYEIHLHPTYRMPTLWFMLHDLPMEEPKFDLNSVYRYLIPAEYKSQLRAAGMTMTGGISAAPHPTTNIPAFFIHPCQTKEAMEIFDCPMENYLMVWLGLVGGCVGLWVPPEMAVADLQE